MMMQENIEIINENFSKKINTEVVIEINNLKKSFAQQEVLKNISLQLFTGENLVVLGKSGSGKSVLIKCIVSLLLADSGTIKVFGKDITGLNRKELSELRKQIGFLFQSGALYDSMTVKENLEFPLKRIKKDISQKEMDEKINEVLENVGLIDALHKMPSQLSGGMRKRISLARTIVVDPLIMLYDEPTTGLDPITSDEISLLINEVQKKYKTSSIIITHDIKCAKNIANRMIMLQDGKVYLEGKTESFENSSDPFIKSFFN
ncbi:bacitracin export ATP-binding protein BceA [mine drainage metagenome]|uniref:Bacitracin export ATP-binding protein BceA n=1 Tax=mine drainage metagenome TaxID=410659 RepID=A0A1J5SCK6_9ZZZZ